MKKFLPVVFCGIAAISYSQLTLAGDDAKQGAGSGASSSAERSSTPSGAGPTDNPNVTRDAQGREHVNKGKHTGQTKNKKDRDAGYSSGAGSSSAPKSDDANKTSPSVSGSSSGSASGSTSESVKTQ